MYIHNHEPAFEEVVEVGGCLLWAGEVNQNHSRTVEHSREQSGTVDHIRAQSGTVEDTRAH